MPFGNFNEILTKEIKCISRPLHNPFDLDPLLKDIGDARIVMLGEASHGTHEYYLWRTHISKMLVEGNYVPTIIPERYDAFVYIDESEGLHALGIKPQGKEATQIYPWGV